MAHRLALVGSSQGAQHERQVVGCHRGRGIDEHIELVDVGRGLTLGTGISQHGISSIGNELEFGDTVNR